MGCLLQSFVALLLLTVLLLPIYGWAQSEHVPTTNPIVTNQDEEKPVGYPNWKTATFGGKQFWTDLRNVSDWRVQVNSETGHHRLIDPDHVRHAWGNRLHCDQALDQLIVDGKAVFPKGKVVILLHGLIRTNNSMEPLAKYLREKGGYTTINFQYASTRKNVESHASALRELVNQLGTDVTEINFVCHSLGNIVVRNYLYLGWNPLKGIQGDPRIKRMVMIGPPNQGSRMARILKNSVLFQTFGGVSGMQLAAGWNKLNSNLATPRFEFGIIAGGQKTDKKLSNFVLKGKDDFTVSLEETKLPGAHDLMVRPLLHSTMMHQPETMSATLSFLQNGYFISQAARQPLKADKDNG